MMKGHLPGALFAKRDDGDVTEVRGLLEHELVIAAEQDGRIVAVEPELQRLDALDVVIAVVAGSHHPQPFVGRPVEAADQVGRAQHLVEVGRSRTLSTGTTNDRHHSGISFVTPAERHDKQDVAILDHRRRVYQRAQQRCSLAAVQRVALGTCEAGFKNLNQLTTTVISS